MNLLYCGDDNIADGLIISILSLLKNVDEDMKIFVLTMTLQIHGKQYQPVSEVIIDFLNQRVKKTNPGNSVVKLDVTELFKTELPDANMETRFTPYCMLRLFADKIPELPDRILYLDNDVICRKNCSEFYYQDISNLELAGVLDHYGKWFFRNNLLKMDYINSGVLLLNLKMIRETGLFEECRALCKQKKMFMPDQSAINKLSKLKTIQTGKFNEQRKVHENTVLQHFTTSFRFFPWLHTLTVKPWQINRIHNELILFEYDDILDEYKALITNEKGC
ncbi:glycosyltransferase [Anaerocolumna sp. MB42-C2]|uniref:glycosyltransferase n=1 Tax=Anaerocolumna sp. MB42-C2 TaxID=3070997 RepID=UPI0027DFEF06|nr:glycosyltransferase [Anaerocolumna sp. MB42-C2]WMJ87238.1 glycosyltransferase [Anaerocolumna sp. MB42-C2]